MKTKIWLNNPKLRILSFINYFDEKALKQDWNKVIITEMNSVILCNDAKFDEYKNRWIITGNRYIIPVQISDRNRLLGGYRPINKCCWSLKRGRGVRVNTLMMS